MKHFPLFLGAVFLATRAEAHGFAGSGLVYPLTGLGNMLAVIAIGAWSAQIGGRAVWVVPAVFGAVMLLVGAGGLSGFPFQWAESLTALSVLILGGVVVITRPIAWPIAIGAVLAVGVVHGHEMSLANNATNGVVGFWATSAALLVVGVVGASLLLEIHRGRLILRGLGGVVALTGLGLVIALV